MSKQWIYRNGDKPFGVAKIELPDGGVSYVSVTKSGRLVTHRPNGTLQAFANDGFDLIPYEPYSDYELDDKVYVTDYESGIGIPAHWAGLDEDGRPTTFIEGGTSFTRMEGETVSWTFCKKAKPTTEDK
jgi:hypothetical protein